MISKLIEYQDKLFFTKNHDDKEELKANIQQIYDDIILEQLQGNQELVDAYYATSSESSKQFILWRLYFPKVFKENGGFDAVIGNPPYVQIPKGVVSKRNFPYSEGKDKGKQNLYKVFVEQGYNLVCQNGCVCLIVQSSLMCDLSSMYTRELLLEKTTISRFIEFPKKATDSKTQVFESVLQGTCICMFNKKVANEDSLFNISIGNNSKTISMLKIEKIRQSLIKKIYPESLYIPLIKQGEYGIIEKVFKKSKFEDWYFRKTSTNNHVMGYELKQLPIPNVSDDDIVQITDLVLDIIENSKKGIAIHAKCHEINQIIYNLYELTDKEIKMVEGEL